MFGQFGRQRAGGDYIQAVADLAGVAVQIRLQRLGIHKLGHVQNPVQITLRLPHLGAELLCLKRNGQGLANAGGGAVAGDDHGSRYHKAAG